MLLRLVKFHCIFMCSLTCSPPCMPLEYDGFRGISYMLVSMHVCPSVHVLGFDQGDLSLSRCYHLFIAFWCKGRWKEIAFTL